MGLIGNVEEPLISIGVDRVLPIREVHSCSFATILGTVIAREPLRLPDLGLLWLGSTCPEFNWKRRAGWKGRASVCLPGLGVNFEPVAPPFVVTDFFRAVCRRLTEVGNALG